MLKIFYIQQHSLNSCVQLKGDSERFQQPFAKFEIFQILPISLAVSQPTKTALQAIGQNILLQLVKQLLIIAAY